MKDQDGNDLKIGDRVIVRAPLKMVGQIVHTEHYNGINWASGMIDRFAHFAGKDHAILDALTTRHKRMTTAIPLEFLRRANG